MAYEKQHTIRAELDSRYPKIKSNLGQQMFRSCYFNARMAGRSHEAARDESVATVRQHVPGFTPTEQLPPPILTGLVPRRDATTQAIRDSGWMRNGSGQRG